MGRMLDALKKGGPALAPPNGHDADRPPEEPRPVSQPLPPPEESGEADGFGDEDGEGNVPFIEVGPGRLVEGSPDVLGAGPPPRPAPPRDGKPLAGPEAGPSRP